MSTPNKINARQIISSDVLSKIALAAGTTVQDLLKSLNSEVTSPFNMTAAGTLVVSIGSSRVANPITSYNHTVSPIGGDVPSFTSGTITFPSTSGGTATVSPGNSSTITLATSQFLKVTVYLDSAGNLNILSGTPGSTEALATTTAAPSGTIGIGYVTLQNVAGVIQNITAANVYQFVGTGGSGSGSGSGTGDDLDSLQFRASFNESFPESAISSSSSVNAASPNTNAVYSAAKAMWTMSYDAGKTITTTGTAFTLSATPAYTIAAGDVIQSGGVVRKIVSISSQTTGTLEAAFPTNLATAAGCVSQAVITKDIYNLAVDGVALSAAFGSATFSEILVDYKDNATAGSNLFTPNTTPLVAFVASPDNTNFTTSQSRATNETDLVGDTLLTAAGTSLYLRFYSNASSGSGIVNLINYRAFMQKSPISAGGGVINASYAFLNGVGTPVNCSLSVVGGKSTITLVGYQYAVGVNPGLPYGSVDVLVNGQLLPRFINSTLTPDGSYVETSPKVITLDKDYSSINYAVMIVQRVSVVDSSTSNTSNISALQEINSQGSQPFINTANLRTPTSTAGTPSAGAFYSSITGRASIVDISQDLKASFGLERFSVQNLQILSNEFGPNGESVYSILNDDRGLCRVVGTKWLVTPNGQGNQVYSTGNTTDYVEIVFYGTGLNMITTLNTTTHDIRSTVDGGTESGNLASGSFASILSARNFTPNQILNVASGLTLGVHTVKIRNNNASVPSFDFNGFEIIGPSASINVNPGTSYGSGQKSVTSSVQSIATNSTFESGSLGSTGGRVVIYQKADGTIAKAVTAVGGSSSTFSAADHTNEESRVYHFREFGAGRTDDFSGVVSSSNRSFTLDDDTLTLAGFNATVGLYGGQDGLFFSSTTYYIITFVGTGLDIACMSDSGLTGTYTVSVDGSSIGALTVIGTGGAQLRNYKLVSGLPYGTHSVKIACTAGTPASFSIVNFKVYQPKKPAIPTGAIELADYNAMATYSQRSTTDVTGNTSSGILRKMLSREMLYVGTWTHTGVANLDLFNSGQNINTSASGSYVELAFFGTGAEARLYFNSGAVHNITFLIDGLAPSTTNFSGSSATFNSAVTGFTFVSTTGVLSGTAGGNGNGYIKITGLPIGFHKIRMTTNTTTGLNFDCYDIITPLHSSKSNLVVQENALPVGSNAISDNRKTTPNKDLNIQNKAWSQVFGVSVSPSTTSTALVPLTDMSTTVKTSGGTLKISGEVTVSPSASNVATGFQVYVDGAPVGEPTQGFGASSTTGYQNLSVVARIPVAPGVHKVDLYWSVNTGTATAVSIFRNLLVEEV